MTIDARNPRQPRLAAKLLLALVLAGPASAQVIDIGKIEKRVTTLEGQVRAVQRKVFPGGDAKFFEPEITTPPPAEAAPAAPASLPIDDLTQRVDALETQLRTMTGQLEAQQFRLQQLETASAKARGDLEFRVAALEKASAPPPPAEPIAAPTASPVASPAPGPVAPGSAAAPAAAKPAAAVPAKPATAEAAWAAALALTRLKDWPAVETAMRQFGTDWPKSARVPVARYWQGRSLAERGQHAAAAKLFLDLYKSAPASEKAPDALLGLATAMNGLNKPQQACQVLDELASVYAEKLTPALQATAKAQRARAAKAGAQCPG